MIDLDKLSEDIHYQIIPQEDDEKNWDVRILEEFPETIIRFGNIKFEGEGPKDENGYLSFNSEVIFSPDPDLTMEDLTLQEYCGRILNSIIETSIADGSMIARDDKTGEVLVHEDMLEELENEYQFGTDSSEELTD